MFVPFFTRREQDGRRSLFRRKGGGGKGGGSGGKGGGSSGKGGGSGGKGGGSSSKGSGSKGGGSSTTKGKTSSVSLSGGKTSNGKSTATRYGHGGGKSIVIPSGQLFSGRTAGGGSRSQVFGSRYYGSGYPGYPGIGVAGRGFPFYFWPVVWGGGLGYGGSYLYDHEYGDPTNSSRPGGALYQATFTSIDQNSTFHVVSDDSTLTSLITSVQSNCSSSITSSPPPTPIPYYSNSTSPLPEQAIQYYRSSSVVLSLDGYNNTAALTAGSDGNTNVTIPDLPLPTWVNATTLDCLNQTIGAAVPLIDGAGSLRSEGLGLGLLGVGWVVWWMMGTIV
ncbi:hypothetical protein JAAARDRAFT_139228 [Jaapia argillacea MUCL 33604]|uniref:Uncharacterized protein n=1 Tax=Jaapia argillacea MUCL 33604 TaxID=933084 RepID=A0A067PBM6_9AGAM|nr:hypothetical protein JAAARDRAFT_139228 [Jaapia argillacea MUCL 33604]